MPGLLFAIPTETLSDTLVLTVPSLSSAWSSTMLVVHQTRQGDNTKGPLLRAFGWETGVQAASDKIMATASFIAQQ